jgi:hypothetical protein
MRVAAMDDDGGMVEAILKNALISIVADRWRHFALGIRDHAVGRYDHITFDAAHVGTLALEVHDKAEQRQHADDNDNHADDLFDAPLRGQHVDQVKDQDNDDEGNQHSDEKVHEEPRLSSFDGLCSRHSCNQRTA